MFYSENITYFIPNASSAFVGINVMFILFMVSWISEYFFVIILVTFHIIVYLTVVASLQWLYNKIKRAICK
jgi:type IV secretory pathway VirB3-like protein